MDFVAEFTRGGGGWPRQPRVALRASRGALSGTLRSVHFYAHHPWGHGITRALGSHSPRVDNLEGGDIPLLSPSLVWAFFPLSRHVAGRPLRATRVAWWGPGLILEAWSSAALATYAVRTRASPRGRCVRPPLFVLTCTTPRSLPSTRSRRGLGTGLCVLASGRGSRVPTALVRPWPWPACRGPARPSAAPLALLALRATRR